MDNTLSLNVSNCETNEECKIKGREKACIKGNITWVYSIASSILWFHIPSSKFYFLSLLLFYILYSIFCSLFYIRSLLLLMLVVDSHEGSICKHKGLLSPVSQADIIVTLLLLIGGSIAAGGGVSYYPLYLSDSISLTLYLSISPFLSLPTYIDYEMNECIYLILISYSNMMISLSLSISLFAYRLEEVVYSFLYSFWSAGLNPKKQYLSPTVLLEGPPSLITYKWY